MSGFLLLVLGLGLAMLGAAGAAALVTTARSELAEAVSRRLRGAEVSFAWLAEREGTVVASMALSSLGVPPGSTTSRELKYRVSPMVAVRNCEPS
ncbi:MAG TPA: hypothetical protein PLL69_05285, partial [Gemmatimonadales bacterium]|nr:hypothetical protein [Gemmatimonadales bacterium]